MYYNNARCILSPSVFCKLKLLQKKSVNYKRVNELLNVFSAWQALCWVLDKVIGQMVVILAPEVA